MLEFAYGTMMPCVLHAFPIIIVSLILCHVFERREGWQQKLTNVWSFVGTAAFAYISFALYDAFFAYALHGFPYLAEIRALSVPPLPEVILRYLPQCHWGCYGELLLLLLSINPARELWKTHATGPSHIWWNLNSRGHENTRQGNWRVE